MSRLKTSLPESLAANVKSTIADWQSSGKVKRLWDRDASLWTGEDESKWLGWRDIVDEQLAEHDQLQKFANDVPTRGFEQVLLLGMGGSSLCPEVLAMTFGRIRQHPALQVPAVVMGLDTKKFLDRAAQMVRACGPGTPVEENPGVRLGIILGARAKAGRDKVTLLTSPGIADLGAWLEQLLAESTGKAGKGIIPVDRERLAAPDVYGSDRLFVYICLENGADQAEDAKLAALLEAGEPVVRITLPDIYDLGAEFFRWEIATAVAGAVIGINAFNQPDVEASKVATRALTSEYEKTGSLPAETPILEDRGIQLFTDDKNAAELGKSVGQKSLSGYLKAHLNRIHAGDYFAVLGYMQMNREHEQNLETIRHAVRDKKRVATCLGFGPRFLHSTGQAYKGGPNSGVFFEVTCEDSVELPVPGQNYTFGIVKRAQARGDFQVLAERGRRALRVHLGQDLKSGLAALEGAVEKAL